MIIENDYIKANSIKKYRFFCDICGKDRGYLAKNRRGGSKTGHLCLQCANRKDPSSYCKHCSKDFALPSEGESNDHWYWQKTNDSSIRDGHFRCKVQLKKKAKRWDSQNPDKVKEKKVRGAIKYRSRPQGRIRASISARMSSIIAKREGADLTSKFSTLDWTIGELMSHLESKFQPGMTWDNYGKNGWHIDHVVPDSWFNYDNICSESFKKSWSLENLQPMWAKDNLSKHNRYAGGVSSQF